MRLDIYVSQKLNINRSRAKDLINQECVVVNDMIVTKAGYNVKETDRVIVETEFIKYVSRAGLKLEKALEVFNLDVKDKTCLDIGSSTGGFTDCLLDKGAKTVYAVDVGKDQFKLGKDKRIKLFEETDIRDFINKYNNFDFVCCDVSFISITNLSDVFTKLRKKNLDLIILIKPQFELSKEELGKNGIVQDPKLREKAIERVRESIVQLDYVFIGVIPSPILGKSGNVEYLAHFKYM